MTEQATEGQEPPGLSHPEKKDRRTKRHFALVVAALAIAIIGTVGSSVGANTIARNNAAKSQQAFRSASGEVASTLQLAIQHEDDLVISASAFVAGNPQAINSQFVRWGTSVRALARYPELVGLGYVAVVPATDLQVFARQAVIDPAGPLDLDGSFQVTPSGARQFYCLTAGAVSRNVPTVSFPAGFDYCASNATRSLFVAARDSGRGIYTPYKVNGDLELAVNTPAYQGGVIPPTIAQRRAAFLGMIATVVVPRVLLTRALHGHADTAVTFAYHAGTTSAVFTAGKVPIGPMMTTISLHNGWRVTVFGLVNGGGLFANRGALALLITGTVLSLLLGALMFVLATSRARALYLVGQRTGDLRHQALHDALTGLPNRALIMDRTEQMLARDRRFGTTSAALFIDLDNFKDVNDTLGHGAGDRLLMAVAARLETSLRDADTIGRLGGDEFVVLIDGAVSPELVAERLLEVMRQPFDLDGASMPLIVNVSVGIAVGGRMNPEDLLRDADVALYQAKAAGKNRFEIFQPEMQTEISRRTDLEFALRSALIGDQFRLVYQPIYNLDDLTLTGVEALLRWDHPIEGIMQPDDFIPILEQTGQIREVGRWVLTEACAQMAAWHTQGDALDVSVNVSGRQLDDDAIVDHVREALSASGLTATSLIIEVTETALMRNANVTAVRLQAIKDLGVKIAVDDFGTGYSSLAYLRQFPVDCLKIDRMFTQAITSSPESKALVGTLVQLGRDLGLRTLAEGVETTDEMDRLREEHVDEAQGFLLARPLDAETLEVRLLAPGRSTGSEIDQATSG
jgi:diguanylate cyclase (GGDEF)-like protein